jgi:hypothetical protein
MAEVIAEVITEEELTEEQLLEHFIQLADDFTYFAPRSLIIRTKEEGNLPFALNDAQMYIHEIAEAQQLREGRVRIIVLKGRQQGMSTYIEGRFYWKVIHRKGVRAYILTHEGEATQNLFDMASRYHEHCPPELKPSTDRDSGKELHFDLLDSGYKVGTAGSRGTGRSSTIQYFHGSEVAFWPHAETHTTGVMQAVPETSGEIWLESTSDGMGNYFHTTWVKATAGLNGFIPVFIPWFWQSEYELPFGDEILESSGDLEKPGELELLELYGEHEDPRKRLTPENLMWRRRKVAQLPDGVDQFKREYPNSAQEAFENAGYKQLISAVDVGRAIANGGRVNERGEHLNIQGGVIEARGPMILGVDPARFGDDRLAICLRQGRVIWDLTSHAGKTDQMEIVGLVKQILDALTIDACFIDEGMGVGVIDRLHEQGYGEVEGVNFGSKAYNQMLYSNRRNEMWQEMGLWFADANVVLINSTAEDRDKKTEECTMDLCAVEYKFSSKNTKELESKDQTKERLKVSPDCGDAAALTFARAVAYSEPPPEGDPDRDRDNTGY